MRIIAFVSSLLTAVSLVAGVAFADPWMGHLVIRDPAVWPQGRSGNYGTVKYFIDERAGDRIPMTVEVQVWADGRPPTDLQVEVFSNVNRRHLAKAFEHPDAAGYHNSYWMNYPMQYAGQVGNNHLYRRQILVFRTGAYRLTTRFKIADGDWLWHNQFAYDGAAQRDAAVVVSPKKVLDMAIYEANTLVVEAFPGGTEGQRSTLEDMLPGDNDGFDPFNLNYVRHALGLNTLWLMPVFPNTRERLDPWTGTIGPNLSPGSPYSARDFFSIDPRFAEAGHPAAAMAAFQKVVAEADAIGLDVMIDVAFNHSGGDTVYGEGGVELGLTSEANARIRDSRPWWATSRRSYREHAHHRFDIAPFAPADRLGEHRWYDAGFDWFFGNYSSLGPKPSWGDASHGGALDERDLLYTDLDPDGGHDFEVENVWNYFAHVLRFWLDRTDGRLAGIRADFAQGLPPQAWEYIVNKTRDRRWDFVFLAEVLDPDQVRYRSNRQFDIVTTVDHTLYRSNDATMSQLFASLEGEASVYGYNAAVMHNGTSHDEEANGNVWLMVARHAVAASLYGTPMVHMGQPLGIPHKIDFESSWQNIKHHWDHANPHVKTMYRRINEARHNHPALRGLDRWFLNRQRGSGFNEAIFSVARWSGDDVVLVFVNLRDHRIGSEVFSVPTAVPLNTATGVRYQAFNLLADNPDQPLWPQPRTAADIYANGIYVGFSFPNESQYLQLRPVL
jgi:hypothetical protein